MATWGIKVSEDLKEKLDRIKKESGMEGEQFAEQLVTLFLTEELKMQKPQLSSELEELQVLTQRIYGIYLHSAERTENLLTSKDESYATELSRRDLKIRELENNLIEANQKYETLGEAYNNLSEDKNKVDEENKQLIDGLKTKQELIDEYKSKNDTLTGIVNEYKEYKEANVMLSKSLQDTEKELGNINILFKDKEAEIKRINENIQVLEKNHAAKLEDLKSIHKNELDRLKQHHQEEIQSLNDKAEIIKDKALIESDKKHQEELKTLTDSFNNKIAAMQDRISNDNEKYKSVLEELETLRATVKPNERKNTKSKSEI